ncbi:SDR family oxidoreductase [Phenylobacterium sp. LjRoot219]|uniref:SDR family oxidoreductase n=1 Tax=Phenylobacterium sp. LjRoot219 TaxID=3342283 RepID=UPI003ECD801B
MKTERNRRVDLAVVGASALFPGSIGGQAFWRNILDGRDFMTEVPPENWLVDDYYDPDPSKPGKIYARRGAFLPKVDFDPIAQGLPPNQLSTTDTAQLLALIVAQKVLDDAASVQFGKVNKRDISVILGVASATELVGQMSARIQRPHWVKALREMGMPESQVQEACARIEATYPEWDESTFPGLLGNVVAGRIANRLDLGGANCVVDAACASSLGAVAMAAQELQLGHSDLVITGGVDALNDVFMYMCFSKTPALSPTGDCRPFAEGADGTMLGEGVGMVALRRLEDAERDGDKIYAVLRGIGSSSDGRAKSIYAPRSEGQEIAIRRAYERAGYGPEEVGLVEAHGTATKAGDLAEFDGLRRAFSDVEARQTIALGSVKSQIGHTKSAAGAASLFKMVMALHHKVLPPTLKVDQPNSRLKIDESPFYLNTETRPWVQSPGATRKASVSSFGFGGSNFHVTLEEYAGEARAPRVSGLSTHLLLLAADDAQALMAATRALSESLATRPLAALARESQLAFSATARVRLAVVAGDEAAARANLAAAAEQIGRQPDQAFSYPNRLHYAVGAERPKLGFLFPGQGSQYVNMGRALAIEFDAARQVWDAAAGLQLDPERALHQAVFPVPVFSDEAREAQAALLTRTDWAQPAIGGASLALLGVLEQAGVRPDAVAGHSYGEIVALHAAGAIPSAADMLAISRRRGELMRAADAEPGAMLAVRASQAEVQALIAEHGADVSIANVNSPQQVVVAGARDAVAAFQRILQQAGRACANLPVATAFHTAAVAGSAEPFGDFLAERAIASPRIAVYGNTRAEPYGVAPEEIRATLARQLAEPVRFADMVERMYADGCRLFLEVGPGAVLTGMVADCLAGRPHVAVATDHRKLDGRAALFNALGVLSVNGVAVDYAALWAPYAPIEAERPEKLSPAAVKLGGANYGKPYPAGGSAARPGPNPEPVVVPPAAIAPQPAAAAPALVQPAAPATGLSPDGWAAFQAMQQNLLEAQKTFTETMAASHQAFLRASEASMLQLGGALGLNPPSQAFVPTPAVVASVPAPAAAVAQPVAPAPVATPAPAAAPASDVTGLLLEVVAEKTGYPVEMLSLEMELEAGLGIDSIKRVQILSALQERLPELASVDANALAALNTLGEIVAFAGQSAPSQPAATPTAAPSAPPQDVTRLLLEVVAEKTGYPVEMLSLDMELEAGLGIDSIKRVQILSALQERVPELASVDANALAALNTLGEIVVFAGQSAPSQPVATPSAPSQDVTRLLLEVVADKTGYPVEMLSLDMELEAGLGIDSIKRVQILSALQERVPELGSVDANALAALNTLGEIVAFAGKDGGAGPATQAAAPVKAAKPGLQRLEVEIAETPAPGLVTPALLGNETVWLVGGPSDVAGALAEALGEAGITATPVATAPADARALILLSALEPAASEAAQLALNEAVFAQLQACAGSMAERGRLLVSVQSTSGDFGLAGAGAAAWSAGVAAAAKTAALEWPHVSVKAIDLAAGPAEVLARRLTDELLLGGAQLEVGLAADGRRLAPAATLKAATAVVAPFPAGGVLLVSGGARGVTAACLEALLKRQPGKVAILGRTALRDEPAELAGLTGDAELKRALLQYAAAEGRKLTPQALGAEVREILAVRELKANLARLSATCAEVRYLPVDVSDAQAVTAALAEIRNSFGPIRGLVHAAGVLADKEIRHKTLEQFRRVLAAKADGFRHLLDATRDDALTHIVCFSSVAAWRGNIGQVDYAMANEVLNRVCRAERERRGGGCLVKAIGWGPWAGGMVDAGLEAHFATMGVALIPLDAGAEFFADEFLGLGGDAPEVLFGGGLAAFGGGPREPAESCAFEARFHRSTHPYVASHVIRGKPVVPLVAAHDLALQAVRQWLPEAEVAGGGGIEVGQGMVLDGFDTTGDVFRFECARTADHDRIAVRVLNAAGAVAYRLQVRLGAPEPASEDAAPLNGLAPWPADKPIYDGRLFHGEALHVIECIEGMSAAGISAVLRTRSPAPLGVNAPIDLLDGGLQLTSLWGHEHLGQESLPTAVERVRLLSAWPHGEPVRCEAICRQRSPLATEWTVRFRDMAGTPLAVIEGVKMHLLPARSEAAAGA